MAQKPSSQARGIMQYSFLVAFANDGTLEAAEVEFMKKLALEDGVIDDEEKEVFRAIFARISKDTVSADTWAEIQKFRKEFGV